MGAHEVGQGWCQLEIPPEVLGTRMGSGSPAMSLGSPSDTTLELS